MKTNKQRFLSNVAIFCMGGMLIIIIVVKISQFISGLYDKRDDHIVIDRDRIDSIIRQPLPDTLELIIIPPGMLLMDIQVKGDLIRDSQYWLIEDSLIITSIVSHDRNGKIDTIYNRHFTIYPEQWKK